MSKQTNQQEGRHTLPRLIEYYEVCNKAEGKSPKTVSWYSSNLKCFHQYLRSRHLPDSIGKIDTRLLREYLIYLRKRDSYEGHPYTPAQHQPLSAATIHGHVRTLRAFFSWLVREELVQVNPAIGIKPPRTARKVITTLSDQEIRSIMNILNTRVACDGRNQTILMMLIDTGLRIGELIGLKLEDVHIDDGLLKVLGKGSKERIVPIGSNAQRALQRYLFRYRPQPAHGGITSVFLSARGKPLTENGVKLMFTRLARRSGVTRLHAHLCRHTFATRFLMNGGDVFTLQQILGHSSLEMVRQYVNLASNHVALQHQRFSPMGRLGLGKSR